MLKQHLLHLARAAVSPNLYRLGSGIDPNSARNFAAILSLVLLFSSYHLLPGLKVFGLDEVHYYPDFRFKLRDEGRWINFLLHDSLRNIPLPTASLLFITCAWLVLFRIAERFTQDRPYAAVIASVLLMAPPFVQQSLWPATHLPSLITLLFLTWLSERGISHRLVYLLGGFLLFGMMQNYYFLLPLIFLSQFDLQRNSGGGFAKDIISHLFFWIVGSIVGVMAALIAVFAITEQVGITPAEWRQAKPVESLQDVSRNLFIVLHYFRAHVLTIFSSVTGTSAAYMLGLLLLLALRLRFWRSDVPKAIVLLAVGISFFAFSVPLAAVISMRSLVALSSAMILLLLVSDRLRGSAYSLSIVLLLLAGVNLSIEGHSYLRKHKTEAEFVLQEILSVLPRHPSNYRGLAVFGTVDDTFKEARWFNRPPWTRAIVIAAGFEQFWECRKNVPKGCTALGEKLDIQSVTPSKMVEFVGAHDNIAAVILGGK